MLLFAMFKVLICVTDQPLLLATFTYLRTSIHFGYFVCIHTLLSPKRKFDMIYQFLLKLKVSVLAVDIF